jgi:hypothetical protein
MRNGWVDDVERRRRCDRRRDWGIVQWKEDLI